MFSNFGNARLNFDFLGQILSNFHSYFFVFTWLLPQPVTSIA